MSKVVAIPVLPKDYAYYPSKLREARHARGLSKRDMANRLEITPDGVAERECGYRSLSPEQMVKVTKITDLPLAFFSNPPEPVKPDSIGPAFFCSNADRQSE